MILLELILLVCAGAVVTVPMLNKPFSEDDGSWFYYAFFQDRGVRLFRHISTFGYFGIPWLAAWAVRITGKRSPRFFYLCKGVWYTLTSLSLYWLTFCFWHDHLASFFSALFFMLIWATPNTLFFLTYAEHIFLLPVTLTMISLYYGTASGNPWWFAAAGILSAWCLQIKITALPLCVLFPFAAVFAPSPVLSALCYCSAFACITILPFLLINRKKAQCARQNYLQILFMPVAFYLIGLCEKSSNRLLHACVPILRKGVGVAREVRIGERYIASQHRRVNKVARRKRFEDIEYSVRDLSFFLVLAGCAILVLPFGFDIHTVVLLSLFIVFLLVQQAQQNYYPPHFNPLWLPVAALAGKSAAGMVPAVLEPSPAGIFFCIYAAIQVNRFRIIFTRSFSSQGSDDYGFKPFRGLISRWAEKIGAYVRTIAKKEFHMLVWGDHPALYLYAQCPCPYPRFLFLYTHHGKLTRKSELMDNIRKRPPELVLFFNHAVRDHWSMEEISRHTGIRYSEEKTFHVNGPNQTPMMSPQGVKLCFCLYRRDDSQYRAALLERTRMEERNTLYENAGETLEQVLALFPDDPEALLRRQLMGQTLSQKAQYLSEQRIRTAERKAKAVILKLLGECSMRNGDCQAAVSFFEEACKLNSRDSMALADCAEAYFSIGEKAKAKRLLTKAHELQPCSPDILNNLAVLMADQGNTGEALSLFQQAAVIAPDHPEISTNMKALGLDKAVND